jgi:hypothetical protein
MRCPRRRGISVAHFLTVANIERSARYYETVFGARILSLGDGNAPAYLQLANIWMILNVGGGPTLDLAIFMRSVGLASRSHQRLLGYANRICERFLFDAIPSCRGSFAKFLVEGRFPIAQPPGVRSRYISACLGRFVPLIPLFLGVSHLSFSPFNR